MVQADAGVVAAAGEVVVNRLHNNLVVAEVAEDNWGMALLEQEGKQRNEVEVDHRDLTSV